MARYWVIAPFEYDFPDEWESVWNYDLRNGVISIGWPRLKDVSNLSLEQIIRRHRKTFPGSKERGAVADAHLIYKFFHEISVDDTVIARRGRKIIAAMGTVTRTAFYDPQLHREAYPRHRHYPNHIVVEWQDEPREIVFSSQVFGMQAVHEITAERFRELVADKSSHFSLQDIFPDDVLPGVEFTEGGCKTTVVNAYERDRRARMACLAVHGFRCFVCNMSFAEIYGDIGEGFIHVHHLNPLAAKKKAYRLRPESDLAPVCPNCHAMLHTENPPLTIQALKRIVKKQRRAM